MGGKGYRMVGLQQPVSSHLRLTHLLPHVLSKGFMQKLQKRVLVSEPHLFLLRADGGRSPLSTLLVYYHSLNRSQQSTKQRSVHLFTHLSLQFSMAEQSITALVSMTIIKGLKCFIVLYSHIGCIIPLRVISVTSKCIDCICSIVLLYRILIIYHLQLNAYLKIHLFLLFPLLILCIFHISIFTPWAFYKLGLSCFFN